MRTSVVPTWHWCSTTGHDSDEEKKNDNVVMRHKKEGAQQDKKLEKKERKQYSRGRKKEMLEFMYFTDIVKFSYGAPENVSKCKIRKKSINVGTET